MAFDAFLKIEGIDGESKDSKHPREIELLSYSFGAEQSGSVVGGGGGGAGKVTFQDFTFVSRLQKSSPTLLLACATGQHLKFATMSVRRADNKFPDFYKVRLTDIFVSSFQEGGTADGADGVPLDRIGFHFEKFEIDYSVQDPKGGLGETVQVIFDTSENTAG